jgi:hypothetical protein
MTVVIQSDVELVPKWLREGDFDGDYRCEFVTRAMLPAIRLRNAKELLRYARYDVALSDRIRLLAALDEYSSMTLAEAITAFQETKPVAGLASLVLQRFVSIDLDDELIGPETIVRRRAD